MNLKKVLTNVANTENRIINQKDENHVSSLNNMRIISQSLIMNEEGVESVDEAIPNFSVPLDEKPENIDFSDLKNEFTCAEYAEDVYLFERIGIKI